MNSRYLDQSILLEHLKSGREDAFIYLVDAYNQRLFAYALSLTNDKVLAQDIVQNVFLKTWEKRKKIDVNFSVQNYLFKCTHNEFLNQYKKNRSTMLLEQKYFESLNRAIAKHDEKSLKKALELIYMEVQTLPPKCREVFLLSRREGLTNIEISEHLDISIKTVEAHITKAFSILRERFDKKMNLIFTLFFGTPIKSY